MSMQTRLEQTKAKDLINEHARDYLSAKIKLQLGNPNLKKVHTNQFLWTELPNEFALENWETIAEVFQSKQTRFTGSSSSAYTVNRWYIEGITIDVDAGGKAEMSLDLNAFPSSLSEFSEGYQSMTKAYQDSINKNSTSTTKNSSTKNTTNAVASDDTTLIKDNYVKKYSIPSTVVNAVKKACNGKKTDKDKAYAWYQWMDKNVGYDYYFGHRYNPDQVIRRGKGNCVDNSRTYRMGCLAMGIKCNFVKGSSCCCTHGRSVGHQWNKVYINGKGVTVDCGRSMASWGSHWGSCSGVYETTSSW